MIKRLASLIIVATLIVACGRPLTVSERNFAATIVGGSVELNRVRVAKIEVVDKFTSKRPKRPRIACRERIWPEPKSDTVTVGTAAFVLFNTVFVSRPLYRRDFTPAYPQAIDLADAMLFAHEMTHVWQWQHRKQTGYTPWKAANEHTPGADPYLLDLSAEPRFLDFPFEQQGAIVEEYVCCNSLDPQGARTKRLHAMLKGVFPVEMLDARAPRPDVVMPWKGATTRGICS